MSYPSLRPLGSYLSDLYRRLEMLSAWSAAGKPPSVFWLPGFFFVQSFLTAGELMWQLTKKQVAASNAPLLWSCAMQELFHKSCLFNYDDHLGCAAVLLCCRVLAGLQSYARRHSIPIDAVAYVFEMLGGVDSAAYRAQPAPPEGMHIEGLFLEGAGWDAASKQLTESQPGLLFVPAPVMWFRPKQVDQCASYSHYNCPMYRTADRRGVLATTGHSTNFVMFVRLPTQQTAQHWTMRGVALLTQLSD